jgi:hypothetical protein
LFLDFDVRNRRAFFAEGLNIGRLELLNDLAAAAGLDVDRMRADLDSGRAREAVLAEALVGRERFRVRGTPTIMLADGTKLRHPIAYARMRDERVIGVTPLPCHGDGCIEATRELFEQALRPERAAPAKQ